MMVALSEVGVVNILWSAVAIKYTWLICIGGWLKFFWYFLCTMRGGTIYGEDVIVSAVITL